MHCIYAATNHELLAVGGKVMGQGLGAQQRLALGRHVWLAGAA